MVLTMQGRELERVIKKAIDDQVITNAEYEAIINAASADGIIDNHERILLKEFKNMIVDKTIKKVRSNC